MTNDNGSYFGASVNDYEPYGCNFFGAQLCLVENQPEFAICSLGVVNTSSEAERTAKSGFKSNSFQYCTFRAKQTISLFPLSLYSSISQSFYFSVLLSLFPIDPSSPLSLFIPSLFLPFSLRSFFPISLISLPYFLSFSSSLFLSVFLSIYLSFPTYKNYF